MRNMRLEIQYDGSRYRGWQRLSDSENTVQGKLEKVLSIMTGENIEITGSGRTDAGAHALSQTANFKTDSDMSIADMLKYCYTYLPEDIVVKNASEADLNFHSRYNVKAKVYKYVIYNDTFHDVFLRKYSYHIPEKLNIDAMKKAAALLLGEHDFIAFSSVKPGKKSTVRNIFSIDIRRKEKIVEIEFKGDGFLYNMVRIITGTLIETGLNRMPVDHVSRILSSGDRTLAGPTVPAQGLFLIRVDY